jgi:enoyl-CoA hydratase/carnithine racemase
MSFVEFELADHVAVMTFNRPEQLNAMNLDMRRDFTDAMRRFNEDDDAWVGILTGAGRAFCAGRDLKAQAEGYAEGDGRHRAPMYDVEFNLFGVSDTEKPLVAAVNGFAIGLGWYMSMDCDIRIAAADAEFAMTEVPTGALGPYWLSGTELLPWPLAAEFALTGGRVRAERLLSLGLLNAVVPAEVLMDEAHRWADKLAALPPMHVRRTKALMRRMRSMPSQEILGLEREAREYLMELEDSKEAVLAWNERRSPRYQGR